MKTNFLSLQSFLLTIFFSGASTYPVDLEQPLPQVRACKVEKEFRSVEEWKRISSLESFALEEERAAAILHAEGKNSQAESR
ncbi:MAG: hypothetical protein ACK5BR_05705 [Bacteroidota bacterium]|jgi:hypothetical protein